MFTKLTQEQLNQKMNFIKHYTEAKNSADGSKFDANANVTNKNVATLQYELNKDIFIQLNRKMLTDKIATLFSQDLATEYIRQLDAKEIYKNDETSLSPYCVSISMYPFLLNGLKDLGGESKAPTNLDSFCGSFINLIFAISAQFSGAVAAVEFFAYFNHFAEKQFGENYLHKHQAQIAQYFQQIIYTLNQPAMARGYQCVFFNVSCYDEPYFNSLFENFIFPTGEAPNYQNIKKLQEYFLTWITEERTKAVLTFPVITCAMLTKDGIPVDSEFEQMCADQLANGNSFFIYQSESADSLSSCCFEGNEVIIVDDKAVSMKEFVEKYTTTEIDSVIPIKKEHTIYSFNPNTLKMEETYIVGVLKKRNQHQRLIKIVINGKENKVTPDHVFLALDQSSNEVVEVHAQQLLNAPKRFMIPIEQGQFNEIAHIEEVESLNSSVYDISLEKNHYFSANGIISHNCRLRNMIEDNTFSYTLGAGGVATGSIGVITVNYNRLVQDGRDLATEITKVQCYLYAYRKLMEDFYDQGMLQVYNAGFISLNKQYVTIGINGFVEGCEYLGYEISNNDAYLDFAKAQLQLIADLNVAFKKKYNILINTEMVPAENVGVKFSQWDKEDGYKVDRECYNSYFYLVENELTNMVDKFVMHGKKMTEFLDGGSALHLNLDEKMSADGFKKLIRISAKTGCSYFCINVKMTICNQCHHIDKTTQLQCKKCGSGNIDYATRIIGYLKRVSAWSTARQKEHRLRHYHKLAIKP